METLELKKECALKAYNDAKSSGKKLLENLYGKKVFLKDVMERIKTFKDVLEDNQMTLEQFVQSCEGLPEDEIGYRRRKLLYISLNEGWIPDYTDGSSKYEPIFTMGSSSGVGFAYRICDRWRTHSHSGSRLCLKCPKLAKYAGTQFLEIHKQHLT